MVGMLFSVASFTYEGKGGACTIIAILLHYFILSALCWMCVDAHNLYRDLVKVFNTNILSSTAFFLRASLFAYGKWTKHIVDNSDVKIIHNLSNTAIKTTKNRCLDRESNSHLRVF